MESRADLDEVLARECRLMDRGVRNDPEQAGALLDPEFREFGSSGRTFDRAGILAALSGDTTPAPAVEDMTAIALGPDAALVTYRTVSGGRSTLRSSVWRRTDAWRALFHQGTPA